MKTRIGNLAHWIKRSLMEDGGGEVIEYALILGIVIVVTVVTVGGFGTKVMAKWTSVNASM